MKLLTNRVDARLQMHLTHVLPFHGDSSEPSVSAHRMEENMPNSRQTVPVSDPGSCAEVHVH